MNTMRCSQKGSHVGTTGLRKRHQRPHLDADNAGGTGLVWFIVQALCLFLPAFMANMAPVFAMKLFPKWDARIDRGRNHKDGKPLLGAGKTWRGLVAGSVLGSVTALAPSFVQIGRAQV